MSRRRSVLEWGVKVTDTRTGKYEVVEFGTDRAEAERQCAAAGETRGKRYELVNRRVTYGAWWTQSSQPGRDYRPAERRLA
jgi:hypothetical protein